MTDYDVDEDNGYYEAQADAAQDRYESLVREILDPMVKAELHKRLEALALADPEGNEECDEDALREKIEEELRPEAEEILQESDPPEDYDWSRP